jgi:hypothetical protein
MKLIRKAALATGIAAGILGAAWAAPQQHGPAVTKSLQEHPVTAEDPRLHAFYELIVEARAKGTEKVDASLEKKVREMAREFPPAHGLDAKAWEDHVVDMTGQMLAISKKDPKILASFDSFVVALRGPQ